MRTEGWENPLDRNGLFWCSWKSTGAMTAARCAREKCPSPCAARELAGLVKCCNDGCSNFVKPVIVRYTDKNGRPSKRQKIPECQDCVRNDAITKKTMQGRETKNHTPGEFVEGSCAMCGKGIGSNNFSGFCMGCGIRASKIAPPIKIKCLGDGCQNFLAPGVRPNMFCLCPSCVATKKKGMMENLDENVALAAEHVKKCKIEHFKMLSKIWK